jgi:hypothetical protein
VRFARDGARRRWIMVQYLPLWRGSSGRCRPPVVPTLERVRLQHAATTSSWIVYGVHYAAQILCCTWPATISCAHCSRRPLLCQRTHCRKMSPGYLSEVSTATWGRDSSRNAWTLKEYVLRAHPAPCSGQGDFHDCSIFQG